MLSSLNTRPATVLAVLSVLGACDVTIKDGDVSVRHVRGHATQEWNRTYPIAPQGRFELTSNNGPIEILTGPAGRIEVVATLTAASLSDERANEALQDTEIEEDVAPDRVALVAQRENGRRVETAFKVIVPEDAQVVTSLNNGKLRVEGLRGPVKAMVVSGEMDLSGLRGSVDAALANGSVRVRMAEVTGRVRVEGTNGQIAIEVPRDARATLNVRAFNGGISVTGLNTQEASGRRIRSLESQLNGGGPEIDVRITNGRITIEGR